MSVPAPQTFDRSALIHVHPRKVRQAARRGDLDYVTHGLARGHVQANLAILPQDYAFEFLLFCLRNPKTCPLVEVLEPGEVEFKTAAPGSDVRTDLPSYRIYREGRLAEERPDITNLWRDDHVAFLLGCSNSFDEVLERQGIPQRHLEKSDGRISVYRSSIPCAPAGRFRGPMVVTMRPIPERDVPRVTELSSRFPIAHGGPVHIGAPKSIGIEDLSQVDWGAYNPLRESEVPVYWACGVTPQAVALESGVPEMITHAPGHMFVTDLHIDDQRKG
ncbi:putative hydro-lyase [Pelagibius sp.]|uniref:putative hydro-lyase n=1 Tax=Pelagibius sp. TaxID=1931238 RepID=UPI003BAF466F